MKPLSLFFLLFITYNITYAQTITVNGTITNEVGVPLHYAFIEDKLSKNATFADSTGAFSLKADPSSQLMLNCKGYKDDSVKIAGQTNIKINLNTNKTEPDITINKKSEDVITLERAFKNHNGYNVKPILGTGATSDKIQEVVGSRFLFDRWVPGYIIKANGKLVQNTHYLFNYDKLKGDLYFTEDLNTVIVCDKNIVKGFVLVSPQDQLISFERMLGASDDLYSEVISSGNKYNIYKLIKTTYIPANYKSDGLYSTGNQYDEYTDEETYYLINSNTLSFQQLILKKKALKETFAIEGTKIDTFIAMHSPDKVDESYVRKLGDAMNQ